MLKSQIFYCKCWDLLNLEWRDTYDHGLRFWEEKNEILKRHFLSFLWECLRGSLIQTLDDKKCEHMLIISLFLSITIQPVVVDSTSLHLRIFSVPVVPHTVITTERAHGDVIVRTDTTEPSLTHHLSPALVSEPFVNLWSSTFPFLPFYICRYIHKNWHVSFPIPSNCLFPFRLNFNYQKRQAPLYFEEHCGIPGSLGAQGKVRRERGKKIHVLTA